MRPKTTCLSISLMVTFTTTGVVSFAPFKIPSVHQSFLAEIILERKEVCRLHSSTVGHDNTNNLNYRALGETTRKLLNETKVGDWDRISFIEAEKTVEAWSRRQSRRAALEVERLLRRIIEEQMAGNPYADAMDMTALYTNLIKGWSKCGEVGGAERAEEILDYFQRIYDEMDCYDPLLCGPGIESFNAVISAYSQSGRPDAHKQAIRVLGKLHDLIRDGRTDAIPNKETYAHVLRAYARTPNPDSPELVRKLLLHMEALSETYPAVKPNVNCHNVYIYAISEAMNRGHIAKVEGAKLAQQYLEMMLSSSDETKAPDKWTFNMVLSTWSRTPIKEMPERAENLVALMESYHSERGCTLETRPNANTYNTLLSCYSRSKLPDKAERACKLLQKMKMLASSGENVAAEPDAITYNTVMNVLAKTRTKDSPAKAEELLQEMTTAFLRTGERRLRPTARSVNTCLDAWAKSGIEGADERIKAWIIKMRETCEDPESKIVLRPDKWTYNSYLQALARSGKPDIGVQAEQVLDEMEALRRKGGLDLKPDVVTFTNVIHCIALSGQEDAVDRAMDILNTMEDLHEQGFGDVRPNLFTYNCVINTIAKSKRPGKAKLALNILRRTEEVALRPGTVSFNNVLNACAFSMHKDDDREEVLQIALGVLREAQEGPGANWITYQTAIRVICSFEEDQQKRWELTKEIFDRCCEDGQLTRTVMQQVRFTVTFEQYSILEQKAKDYKMNNIIKK